MICRHKLYYFTVTNLVLKHVKHAKCDETQAIWYGNMLKLHIWHVQVFIMNSNSPDPRMAFCRLLRAWSKAPAMPVIGVTLGRESCSTWKIKLVFSSPEPKAQVSYCHSAPSVVRPSVVVRRRPSSSSSSVNFNIFNFFSRTAWWILMKLGMHEVLMVPYKCCCFSARSAQGRIQGGAKIGHGGSPPSRNFFFRPEGYSHKPNA